MVFYIKVALMMILIKLKQKKKSNWQISFILFYGGPSRI